MRKVLLCDSQCSSWNADLLQLSNKRKREDSGSGNEVSVNKVDSKDESQDITNKKLRNDKGLSSGKVNSRLGNLTERAWGAHNTTMTFEERQTYLSKPPEWTNSLHHVITYKKIPNTITKS